MIQTKKQCLSCKKRVGSNGVTFKCPGCEKNVFRCSFCKKLGVKYKCDCGFDGP